ncbi:MAG: hypothetical protein IPJ66_18745 [Bacteroidetes bacterium]|nr:hypothetical protein [Bacteroidota bacterium]
MLSKFIYVYSNLAVVNSNISKYEYWFDNDYTSAVITSVSPTRDYYLSGDLAAANLNQGLHSFYIRFGDQGGIWSSVLGKFIYKTGNSASGLYQMSNYRYWVDNDTTGIVNKTFLIR